MDYTIPKGVKTIENDCLSSFSSFTNVQILFKALKVDKNCFSRETIINKVKNLKKRQNVKIINILFNDEKDKLEQKKD